MIDWTEIIVSVCTLVFTGFLIPIAKSLIDKVKVEIDTTLNEQDGKLIYEIVETSVRWARQWLQSETGEKKKEEVLKYVSERLNALGIEVDADYIDKLIESVYDTIKSERIAQGDENGKKYKRFG